MLKFGKKIIFLSSILLAIILIAAISIWQIYFAIGGNITADINVKEGYGIKQIASELSQKGLIRSSAFFKIYIALSGKKNKILPGSYRLSTNQNIASIVSTLAGGKTIDNRTTIIEGWRLEQVALFLKSKKLNGDDFQAETKKVDKYVQKYSFLSKFGQIKSLEGFLYPDTYQFDSDTSGEEIVSQMLEDFKARIVDKYTKISNSYLTNPYDIIKLASIIEREVPNSTDRAKVAGLYINRLKIDMKLEADPTVQYQKDSENNITIYNKYWSEITTEDYRKWQGDYNTYLISGLPKNPICSPSVDAINSVINFENHGYYYFFTDSSGKLYFSSNYQEHIELKKKYLK